MWAGPRKSAQLKGHGQKISSQFKISNTLKIRQIHLSLNRWMAV